MFFSRLSQTLFLEYLHGSGQVSSREGVSMYTCYYVGKVPVPYYQ